MRLDWSRMPDINYFYVSINSLIKKSQLGNQLDFVCDLLLAVCYFLKPALIDIFLFA